MTQFIESPYPIGPAHGGIAPSAPALLHSHPIAERERIVAIDDLRGFALLGILIMNIQSFAMPGAAYMNPTAYGNLEGANYWVWYLSHLLADQKFMTIFSMLFGAGIVLMTSRIEASGRGSAGVHYCRMGWLILFGLLHAHLLWYGDILYFYGMCGLAAWLFRKLPPAILIPLGLSSVAVTTLIGLGFYFSLPYWPDDAVASMRSGMDNQQQQEHEIAAYRGGWLEQMPVRVFTALFFETFMFFAWGLWRAGGLMLLGMGLYKLGVFSGKLSNRAYATLMIAGSAIGFPIIIYGIQANFGKGWDVLYSYFVGTEFNYWGSMFVSMAWIGLLMLTHRARALAWLMRRLEAVGRMALTNYLLHTIICTTIFYGHGLGLFGHVERKGQLLIVIGVWIFQLIVSPIWLKHFEFGPAEWLWRTLTYMRAQPFRRVQPVSGSSASFSAG